MTRTRTAVWLAAVAAAWAGSVSAAPPVGWRGDTSGRFLQAEPPTEWSVEEGLGILWKTRMEGNSNSSPIIVGSKVFVCVEPNRLACLDASSGEVRWQAEHGYDQVLSPEVLAKATSDLAAADEIRARLDKLRQEMGEIDQLLQETPEDKKLLARREALGTEVSKGEEELIPLETYRPPDRAAGLTTATPTSDGRSVCVVFGTGIVASYDLEGKRRWIRLLDKTQLDWGHTASPLLIGDLLLVHVKDLTALDARTGRVRWTKELAPSYGSPAPGRVDGEDLIVTAAGDIVRVRDGEVLAQGAAPQLRSCSPVVVDGVAYFIESHARAVRLPTEPIAEPPAPLWEAQLFEDNYFASPVAHNGLIYAVSEGRVLSVLDAANGELVYEERLRFEGGGAVTSSLALAGDLVCIVQESGRVKLIQSGREFVEVAENPLEGLRSSPVFAGDRLFLRGSEHLFCIGP